MFENKKNKLDFILITLFSIYPLAILSGNFTINISFLIIGSIFFYKLIKKETLFIQYRESIFLLIFFFISLLINLIFSNDIYLSYQRVIKFFFVIFFIVSFKYLILNFNENLKTIYKLWSIFFLIVIVDLLIEFFIGKNILGQSAIMPGRLGSFTGQESVIGHFFFGFCLIFLSYFYTRSNKDIFSLILASSLIIISFLIGERANLIRTFLAISLFIFFINKINYKFKILSVILIVFSSYLILFFNSDSSYKARYVWQMKSFFSSNGLSKYLENSQYGAHRNVAKEIFLDNPVFGVGIKNFRIESRNGKYESLEHKMNHLRGSNHPHELYYEFLSETGIFGLICFLIFILSSLIFSIKNYLKKKNIYQLSGIIIVLVSILPVIPIGSFFATYTSSIFWINYAIMMGYNFDKKN
jgi:oligosaccharide repeat unit polymerase